MFDRDASHIPTSLIYILFAIVMDASWCVNTVESKEELYSNNFTPNSVWHLPDTQRRARVNCLKVGHSVQEACHKLNMRD